MGNGSLLLFNDISRLYATRPISPSSLLSYSFIYCLKIDYSLLPHDFALINQNTTSTTMYWLLFTNTVLIIYLRCFGAERTMYWLFTYSSFCANHWTISRSFAHFFFIIIYAKPSMIIHLFCCTDAHFFQSKNKIRSFFNVE